MNSQWAIRDLVVPTVAATLAIFAWAYYRSVSASINSIPGPWYSRWTGAVLTYKWLIGKRSLYVHALHEKYGPIVRIGPNEVDFMDVAAVQTIYDTRETFTKTKWYRKLAAVNEPVMFSITDLGVHRRLRRMLGPAMSESSLKLLTPIIETLIETYIQRVKDDFKTQGVVDVYKWNLFLATDVVGELTFGRSFRMLQLGQKNQYSRDLETVGRLGALRSTFPFLVSLAAHTSLPIFREAAVATSNISHYGKESINRYLELVKSDVNQKTRTLFDKLFQGEQNQEISFEEILANASGYIVAGSHSTATALTYLIWSVCAQSNIRDKLCSEIATLPPSFNDGDLRILPYLNSIINETLRLYPPVPTGLPREVPHPGAEIADCWLDGGTIVCVQPFSMHRDPAIFNSPSVFDPSRWEEPTKAMTEAFMPFGRGPRACVGVNLARVELRLAAARFFFEFPQAELSERDGFSLEEMAPTTHFFLSPRGKRCLVELAS